MAKEVTKSRQTLIEWRLKEQEKEPQKGYFLWKKINEKHSTKLSVGDEI